jgi:nucleoside-diphosphate-sugar epimerase
LKIIIFGSSGFLGNELVDFLLKKKHYVIGCSRNKILKKTKRFKYINWKFGEVVPKKLLSNVNCAIHVSHDVNHINGPNNTIKGTIKIIKFLKQASVKRQIYFSSFSAHSLSNTNYAKTKFILEQKLKFFKDVIIIRPGFIIGKGGICLKIKKILNNSPIFIIPFSKRFKVPVISIKKVCYITSFLLKKNYFKKEFNLFEKKFLSIEDLFKKINEKLKFLVSFSLPVSFSIFFIKAIKFTNFNFNINHENVKGLFSNQYVSHKSDIDLFK